MQEWQAACSLPPSERCQANTASVWHGAAVSAARGETLGSCEGKPWETVQFFLIWFGSPRIFCAHCSTVTRTKKIDLLKSEELADLKIL